MSFPQVTLFCALLLFSYVCSAFNFDAADRIETAPVIKNILTTTTMSISQDDRGFMWFGTATGLIRFDGNQKKLFRHNPSSKFSLINNWINSLYRDRIGRLWIGTRSGLQLFDSQSEAFHTYQPKDSDRSNLEAANIVQIIGDRNNNLWIATTDGLQFFDTKTLSYQFFRHEKNNPASIRSNIVNAITIDALGRVIIGTNLGIDVLDTKQNTFRHIQLETHQYETSKRKTFEITSLATDTEGVWIGTKHGLAYASTLDLTTGKPIQILDKSKVALAPEWVQLIRTTRNGEVWFSSRSGGLYRKLRTQSKFVKFSGTGAGPNINCGIDVVSMFEDRLGVLWLGAWDHEYCYIDPSNVGFNKLVARQTNTLGLSELSVRSIAVDADDEAFILTHKGTLDLVNNTSGDIKTLAQENNPELTSGFNQHLVQKLVADKIGRVWGAGPKGIRRYHKQKEKFESYLCEFEPNLVNHVLSIIQDSQGNFWITSPSGVVICDARTGKHSIFRHDPQNKNSLATNYVAPIAEDHDDNIWMGNLLGLQRYNKKTKTFTLIKNDPLNPRSLPFGAIDSLFVDHLGTLWLGSDFHLSKMLKGQNGEFAFINYQTMTMVASILQGRGGELWLSTDIGISKFNPTTEQFVDYFERDGITSGSFRNTVSAKAKNERIYFGGANGVTHFVPQEIRTNEVLPDTVVTNFTFLK